MKSLFAGLCLLSLTSAAMAQDKQEETVVEVVGQNDAVVQNKTGADNADAVKNVRVDVKITGDSKDKQGRKDEKTTTQRKLYGDGKLNGSSIRNNMQYRIYQLPDRQSTPSNNALSGMSVNFLSASNETARIFLDVDFNNMSLNEALKKLTQKASRDIGIQADVDQEVRVTLKAKKIRLSTAMSAISDQTGLNWETISEVMGDSKTLKTKYRLGKKSGEPFYWPDIQSGNYQNRSNTSPRSMIKTFTFDAAHDKAGSLNPSKNSLSGKTDIEGRTLFPGVPVLGTIFKNSNDRFSNAFTYHLSTQETRSTFTCPHCQKQLTIVSQKQNLKCPDCKRDFLSDWKFCPFDGAKRPASGIEWGFCPICGKDLPHKEGTDGVKK